MAAVAHDSKTPAPGLKLIAKTVEAIPMARVLAGLAALLVGSVHRERRVGPCDAALFRSRPMAACSRCRRRWCSCTSTRSVAPAVIGVIDAAGRARDVATRAVGQSVLIVLPDDLPQGTQIVSYRVVSQDGHPVAGSLVFSIGAVTGGRAARRQSPLAVLIWLARIGVYLGLFVGVGGAFFAAWIGQGPERIDGQPRRVRRPVSSARWPRSACKASISSTLPLGGHRDVGAVDERARDQPRAVAA